jgi:hypothetical protein
MPEIKHAFLAGKMNKSLDDRLVPEGEYRDAQNIEVSTDIEGGGDIGTVRRVKGNTPLVDTDTYFNGTAETIGSFFDDKNNNVYYFVTDDTNHKIYKYNTNTATLDTIARGSYLNFSKDFLITGINILDNFLFWTDNLNPPRRIDLKKIESDGDYYFDLQDEIKVSVVKYSPFLAPKITLGIDDTIEGDYIKERFVRFSYRYKYSDGTYSQLAPFSPIAFRKAVESQALGIYDLRLTSDQVKKAYEQGLVEGFVNNFNKVTVEAPVPSNAVSEYEIEEVEFLLKDANSAAVRIIKKIPVNNTTIVSQGDQSYVNHTYKSEIPVATLNEKELLRVSENAPVKAKSQEIVGNRVVYGNFVENYNIPTLDYTISVGEKKLGNFYLTNLLDSSLKQRRTYEVGIVLSDKFGRKSPVILGNNPTVYAPAKPANFDSSTNEWRRDCLKIQFDSIPQEWQDWYSYRVVVKQTQQEYYNAYLPGAGEYSGKSYISLIGDNINKIPRNTDNVFEGDFARSSTYLYPKVINKSTFYSAPAPFEVVNGEIPVRIFSLFNKKQIASDTAVFSNLTSTDIQKYTGQDFTQLSDQGYIDLRIDDHFKNCGTDTELQCDNPSGVYVFVNGYYLENSEYTYQPTASTNGRVILNTMPGDDDKVDIILKWDQVTLRGVGNSTKQGKLVASLTNMSLLYEAPSDDVYISEREDVDAKVSLSVAVSEPFNNNFIISDQYQLLSDDPYITVSRIGTLSQFTKLPLSQIPSSDKVGFYAETPSNLIAELNYSDGIVSISQKAVDLAVFETRPFESSLDIYYETSTSGLVSELNTSTIIDIDYFNTFIIEGDGNSTDNIPNWHVEESRIRGDFNADSVDLGVIAHTTNPDYSQTRRSNTLIHSGVYNPRTGFNETNQFPSSENITKSLDIQQGSIQKLFAEETNLIVFQEERVSNIPIDRDIIYTAEGNPQVVLSNQVFGDVMAYAGNYGIGTNPESFAYYAGRKYFVDKPKGAVLRLSRDGITEISNYGMRTYFVNQLSTPSNVVFYNDNIFGMWDMAKRQYVLNIGKNYAPDVQATEFPVATFQDTVTRYFYTGDLYAEDADGNNQSYDRQDSYASPDGGGFTGPVRNYFVTYTNYSYKSFVDAIYGGNLPVSGLTWELITEDYVASDTDLGSEQVTATKYNNVVYVDSNDSSNQSLTRGDKNSYLIYVTIDSPLEEADLPVGGVINEIIEQPASIDESVTLSFNESVNGWVSFYDFNPQFGGSIDGKFYTFKESVIYEHHKGVGFYGSTDLDASITLVMNQNPSANKNFLTISYEGAETWNISSITTDVDTGSAISAYNVANQDDDTSIFLGGFKKFDGKYYANILNDSPAATNEIVFGGDVSGIKGHFLNVTFNNSSNNDELFSVSTNYNINSY